MINIGLASDHAGYNMKCVVRNYLRDKQFNIIDFGCCSTESCDYTEFAHLLGYSIDKQEVDFGLAFCGSGNGINMSINKHSSVRAALCWNSDIAVLARKHNNANVCSLPARFINDETAIKIVEIFLSESFEYGRHQKRVDHIPLL